MPRLLPIPQIMSQAEAIAHLGRKRFDHAMKQGWVKPRTVLYRGKLLPAGGKSMPWQGKKGRPPTESYCLTDILETEKRFLGEKI